MVAGYHNVFILEDLEVGNVGALVQFVGLVAPSVDDGFGFIQLELGQGQVVVRREADLSADTGFELCDNSGCISGWVGGASRSSGS